MLLIISIAEGRKRSATENPGCTFTGMSELHAKKAMVINICGGEQNYYL